MADRVELIIQLTGDTRAMSSLRELQRLMSDLNTKKVQLKLDAAEIDRQLADKQRMLKELTARRHDIKISGGDVTEIDKQIEDLKADIADLTQKKKHISIDARLNTEAMTQANAELLDMEKNAFTVTNAISGIGSALSTVGSVASSVGGIFGQMASLAGGNMMNTALRTLTGYGTILATQGLGTATSRFDTFRTFPRVMEVMGYSIDQTDAAVRRLEESVLGLPTSLNDIIDMARDFILLTNDLDKGVDLATSINNLFVAGGADSEQVRIGLKQFRDLLSKGSLMDREWDSLARTLGVSLRFIASEAGYAEEQFGEFRTALKKGEIGVDEFLEAVIRAGSSGRVKSVLEEMKDTLTATLTNLRTAFANLGATVLTEFDAIFERKTGGGLPDAILAISTAIKQQLIPAVREWLTINADRIFAIFDWLRNFDWGALLRGIAENILYVAEKLLAFADAVGHENIIWFLSHGTQWSMMAKQFAILGSALSALGSIISTVGGAIAQLKVAMDGIAAAGGVAALGSAAAPYLAVAGVGALGIGLVVDGYKRGTAAAKEYTESAKGALEGTDLIVAQSRSIAEGVNQIIASQAESFDAIEKRASTAKSLIQEIQKLDASGGGDELVKKVTELQAVFPDLKLEIDEVTGKLTENGRAAAEAAEGYIEYIIATEKAEVAAENIRRLLDEKMNIEIQIGFNNDKIAEIREKLAELREHRGEAINLFGQIEYQKTVKALEDALAELISNNEGLILSYGNLDTVIDAWISKMQEASAEANNNADAADAVTGAAEGTTSAVKKLEETYKELYKAAKDAFDEQIKGFGEIARAAEEDIDKVTSAQQKNADYIEQFIADQQTIYDYMTEQGEALGPNMARMLAEGVEGGLSNAGIVAMLADAIKADDGSLEKLAKAYEAEFTAAAKAADMTATIQTLASAFTDAYDAVLAEGSLFDEAGLKLFSEADLENIREEATLMVEELQKGINAVFAEGSDTSAGITLFSEDTIKAMITPMYEALANEDEGLIAGFNLLRDSMFILSDETIPALITEFEELLEAVEALTEAVIELTEALEDLIDAMRHATDEANKLRGAIIRLKDSMEQAIPVVQALTSEVNTFQSSVDAATGAVNDLISAINQLNSMSVNVPSEVGGSIGFHGGNSGPQEYAKGGPVYLARGGSFWKPHGTDTVPAMLTPGEFVLRKPAVRKLGVPFLNMLNRLDIPRAIDALMSRVTLPSAMSSVVYDNRKTYDNHATVNQNIYTNNPDYAYRRASRWAHAL